MQIVITPDAQRDLNYWVKTKNKKALSKIAQLIESILETPFEGIGKPEPLIYNWEGCWSRRIDQENRLIYEVFKDRVEIYSFKGHYQ